MTLAPTRQDVRAYVLELTAQLAEMAGAFGEADLSRDLGRIAVENALAPLNGVARDARIAPEA